jgi:hypothetical protein
MVMMQSDATFGHLLDTVQFDMMFAHLSEETATVG